LIVKLGLPEEKAQKCSSQVPLSTLAKIMDLCHMIIARKKDYHELQILEKWLECPELKIIGRNLANEFIYNDVKGYFGRHIDIKKFMLKK